MNSLSVERFDQIDLLEGGQKNIQMPKGVILRKVWRDVSTEDYIIQYKKKWAKVNREVITNTEIFTLID